MSHPLFDMLRNYAEPALNADHPAEANLASAPQGWKRIPNNDVKPPKSANENVHHVNIETPEQYIEQEIGLDGKVKK